MEHEEYMRQALALAKKAAQQGEIPVGCVIVNNKGEVIGRGMNTRERDKSALGHAELNAIAEACASLNDWRLEGCTLYVTLEPCPMCAGAIINARIPVVVYGAREENYGSCGSVIDLFSERYGFKPAVYSGVLGDECAELMREFFKELRA
jgi:tRNA(adenine34) deaminase